jgi:hypothetical protein
MKDTKDKEDKEETHEECDESRVLIVENTWLRNTMAHRDKMAVMNAFHTGTIMCCVFGLGWLVGWDNLRGYNTRCV